jgi:hypothetical protein
MEINVTAVHECIGLLLNGSCSYTMPTSSFEWSGSGGEGKGISKDMDFGVDASMAEAPTGDGFPPPPPPGKDNLSWIMTGTSRMFVY